jgi:hypothetical protein
MKIYNIFTYKDQEDVFIEESFSWTALILQIFWLLYHRIWTPALIIITMQICLLLALKTKLINEDIFFNMVMISALIIASFAKTWYIESLENKGYQLKYILAAKNLEEAKLNFYRDEYQ